MPAMTDAQLKHLAQKSTGAYDWDLGDKVLYDLCKEHPRHQDAPAVVAKLWLIGRSYAAAIERGSGTGGDQLYTKQAAPRFKASGFDKDLDALPRRLDPTDTSAILGAHKRLCDILSFTKRERRSFASKYLHFHRPDLFYLYDSRAAAQVTQLHKDLGIKRSKTPTNGPADRTYAGFYRKALEAVAEIHDRTRIRLNPRQFDRLLLFEYPSGATR